MWSTWLLAYLALGIFSGFCAGMFGVGGGAVMVPILTSLFAAQAFPHEHVLHLALGTSLATIAFTSLSSMRAHHARGAVLWPVVLKIAPGIVIGTLLGSQLASHLPTRPLSLFFVVFIASIAVQMITGAKSQPHRELPGAAVMSLVGVVIGGISALVAIGGGSLSVPFMTWCNVRVQQAIGTSSAIGLPIALSGAAGYTLSGWHAAGLPTGSVGYIYLPAVAGTALTSVIFAPLGAKITHGLAPETAQRLFAIVLLLLAAKMLHTIFA